MNRWSPARALVPLVLGLSGMLAIAPSCAAAEPAAPPEVLDIDETAGLLRVPPQVVRALAESGGVPARRVGDAWRFSRAAVLEWLKGGADVGAGAAAAVRAAPAAAPDQARANRLPPTVGERPAAATAEDVALRDSRVLLRRGAATAEFGLSYGRTEQALFPVIRQEQRTLGASLAVRYGLRDDLQATLRVPAAWRRTVTFSDASVGAAPSPRVVRDEAVGDAAFSLLGVASHEAVGRPNLVWSIDTVVPSGPGDRGLGGGLVVSKSYDPAVVFAGVSYLRGLGLDAADPRRSLARHNLGLSLGYTYAINDSLALNTVFVGSYRNAAAPDAGALPPPRERYQLQLGMTWLVSPGLYVEPTAALRLGSATADFTAALNVTQSF